MARQNASQKYVLSSASELRHIHESSIDYVFTDPPFGSNLFYSDMSLFQEAWLGSTTDDREEAVIHTAVKRGADSSERYQELLRKACHEAFRILKPGCCLSMVFGNSSGKIWSMVQRILRESGFEPKPIHIGILDKGQRSVKGLTSGSESVATLDLILTVRKPDISNETANVESNHSDMSLVDIVQEALSEINFKDNPTPSHVYLSLLKRAFELGLPVAELHLADILCMLQGRGILVNPKTGLFEQTNH